MIWEDTILLNNIQIKSIEVENWMYCGTSWTNNNNIQIIKLLNVNI